jgi:hypothetical protein
MKNREWLETLSDEDLAEVLCESHEYCSGCLGYTLCELGDGHANGLLKWLKEEHAEE